MPAQRGARPSIGGKPGARESAESRRVKSSTQVTEKHHADAARSANRGLRRSNSPFEHGSFGEPHGVWFF